MHLMELGVAGRDLQQVDRVMHYGVFAGVKTFFIWGKDVDTLLAQPLGGEALAGFEAGRAVPTARRRSGRADRDRIVAQEAGGGGRLRHSRARVPALAPGEFPEPARGVWDTRFIHCGEHRARACVYSKWVRTPDAKEPGLEKKTTVFTPHRFGEND